jgi:hypothetical protein
MSRTISLYFSETIDPAAFTRAVAALGGELLDAEALDFGFSEQTAHVWIYGALVGLDDPREQPDPYDYPRPFGEASKAHIDMQLSRAPESAALALRIAQGLLGRWPGIASCPVHTVLVRGKTVDALPQTIAYGIAGFEVQVLLSQQPSLSALIAELGGTVINEDNAALHASALAVLAAKSRVDTDRDTAAGVLKMGSGRLWILIRSFDPIDVYRWDLLASTVDRHVRPAPPSVVVRVLIDCSPDDAESMDLANVRALSFARRVSQTYESVLLGTFFVALEPEQVKLVLDSGQWPLVT